MKRLTIRQKLTLWYGGVMAAILVFCAVSVHWMTHSHLLSLVDGTLGRELDIFIDRFLRAQDASRLGDRLSADFDHRDPVEFQVITARGKPVFRSRRFHLGIFAGPRRASEDAASFVDLLCDYGRSTERFRLASRAVPGREGPLIVQALTSLQGTDQAMGELRMVLLLTGPTALAVALAGGYLLARGALLPVERMTAAAAEITSNRLSRRLKSPNPDDEIGRLAATLNDMIGRLARSFDEVRRFTADAAHELRTPLTLMQTEIEVALREADEQPADAALLERLLDEIERLTRLVTQLLFLCREDAGLGAWTPRPLDLAMVVGKVVDHMLAYVEERGQRLVVRGLRPCIISGDEDRLRQLLFNLLENATKYTPADGEVSVLVEPAAGWARVVICDTGMGIPAEHLPRIFDRFYRVDPSRSRETEGTGLGLAICRSIVESHGGRLALESTVGRGTQVTLTLPLASASCPTKVPAE
jgi:two-component system, OmpR family, heavy metal sensor histidine kinase CusS